MRPVEILAVAGFGFAVYMALGSMSQAAPMDTSGDDTGSNTPLQPQIQLIPNSIIQLIQAPASLVTLAFGNKVSSDFRCKVVQVCNSLGIDPSWLMAVMYSESHGTFSASVRNPNGGATGLIQFTQDNVDLLGVSLAQLAAMSAEEQLNYVWQYLAFWQSTGRKLRSVGDVYMAVFMPAYVGASQSKVLFSAGQAGYSGNKGFDKQGLGFISVGMVFAWANLKLAQGMLPPYVWIGVPCPDLPQTVAA